MKKLAYTLGVLAFFPSLALAQPPDPNCVASNQGSQAEGTILGGIGGALIGGALGHGAGALVGGLTGAVAGNAIAGARNTPCPPGYFYAPPPGYAGYGALSGRSPEELLAVTAGVAASRLAATAAAGQQLLGCGAAGYPATDRLDAGAGVPGRQRRPYHARPSPPVL